MQFIKTRRFKIQLSFWAILSQKALLIAPIMLNLPMTHASDNLLNCPKENQYPWIWGNCSILIKPLTDQPKDHNIPFHADFSVTYSYNCQGHETDFGLSTGTSFKKFQMGAQYQIMDGLSGDRPLQTYDPNPALTKRLAFQPGCELIVHKASFTPSYQTLNLWNTEAYAQAKLIRYAISSYELARNFDQYRQWDIERTRQMMASIDSKIRLLERRCQITPSYCMTVAHFKVIKQSLQAKLDQTPNLPLPEDIEQEIETLSDYYRESLEFEVNSAKNMIQRFQRWQTPINQALLDALALAT
jgi:hypothetical protein